MVAIPITNDQPGVASRLEWLGVAEVVPPARLSAARLRASVGRLLNEPHYRVKSQQWKAEIGRSDGLAQAATIVDQPSQATGRAACGRLIGVFDVEGGAASRASGVQTARGAGVLASSL
jgi:UDP:flavonoid glycosyltransferase YjiC (YdhE family)